MPTCIIYGFCFLFLLVSHMLNMNDTIHELPHDQRGLEKQRRPHTSLTSVTTSRRKNEGPPPTPTFGKEREISFRRKVQDKASDVQLL